ncbi:MAG: low molecular weight phosphotyrosine protein phosphatase [Acidobacteria bacterium]|nr:MAG: low molecular weight phosphotyrosine protein phosphatase [Acidobacteriota bacterium]REK05370.1 MAG: low molecular weight phosphotyrosine protein phosphatase [Acidobacteriota bacterium]
MKRVLFVCLGNICRSPTAEGVFRHWLESRGDAAGASSIEVDSAGTSAHHVGEPADPRMRESASRRGYDLSSRARQVRREDFDRFDRIVAMDRDNLRALEAFGAARPGQLRLFSHYLAEAPGSWPVDVPDPYYGGAEGFETVLSMVEAGCAGLWRDLSEGCEPVTGS